MADDNGSHDRWWVATIGRPPVAGEAREFWLTARAIDLGREVRRVDPQLRNLVIRAFLDGLAGW